MSRSINPAVETRKRRRRLTYLWSAVIAAVIIGLIWKEQIALLYVLATLSVAALLIVVALSDLGGARQVAVEAPPLDDSAALADRAASTRR
ncbi:MAG: hypothetical protein H0T45_19645 [Pyrinomonadaceae bacterium]|nr:hypothetical protein [Pyrinomonadaceae bacterium]